MSFLERYVAKALPGIVLKRTTRKTIPVSVPDRPNSVRYVTPTVVNAPIPVQSSSVSNMPKSTR